MLNRNKKGKDGDKIYNGECGTHSRYGGYSRQDGILLRAYLSIWNYLRIFIMRWQT